MVAVSCPETSEIDVCNRCNGDMAGVAERQSPNRMKLISWIGRNPRKIYSVHPFIRQPELIMFIVITTFLALTKWLMTFIGGAAFVVLLMATLAVGVRALINAWADNAAQASA